MTSYCSRYTSGGVIRGNGLLNEWQLKFYGTKQPPQPGFSYDNCDGEKKKELLVSIKTLCFHI